MPQRNVSLSAEMEAYVRSQVDSGEFGNASEVVRAALRALRREQEAHAARVEALRGALQQGAASGVSARRVGDIWEEAERRHLAKNG